MASSSKRSKQSKRNQRRVPHAPHISAGGGVAGSARHEFSAGFLLYRTALPEDGTAPVRLWLLLDYGKHWDYPKGHLEKGETPWQAAVRELREETGIRQVDRRTSYRRQMHYQFFSPRKGRVAKTVTYFVGQTQTATIEVSDEHTGFAWLAYEQALKTLTFENARELLRAAEQAVRERETHVARSARQNGRKK
jgi:8-oxo-dGTP pyrophosphatase MutT (NUDIX family)